jgi:hypothetical protein
MSKGRERRSRSAGDGGVGVRKRTKEPGFFMSQPRIQIPYSVESENRAQFIDHFKNKMPSKAFPAQKDCLDWPRATYGATEKRPGGARSVYYDDICENEFSDEKKRGLGLLPMEVPSLHSVHPHMTMPGWVYRPLYTRAGKLSRRDNPPTTLDMVLESNRRFVKYGAKTLLETSPGP